jgi:hypothetical protein
MALLAVVAVETASARVQDPRLLVAVGVLPQMRQYVDDTEVFAELTRAELMWPVGRAWRAGGEIAARSDFVILGANLHRDFWESPSREWRATVGLGYILPFADTDQLYERLHGDPSEIHDRMLLRLGVGQTFSLDRGRLAFRLGADGRLSPRGSVLAFLESLDDGPDVAESIVVVEVYAGFEVRLGRHP